jgi:short-subunit dehydrogenase
VELDGARVLLTGASSGIGAALAPMLAARGATVALVARRADRLEAIAAKCQEHTPGSRAFPVDLAQPTRAARAAVEISDAVGGVDCLVNNAAMPKRVAVERLIARDLNEVMDLNFHTPVQMTLALLPRWLAADRGAVVNVSSMGGRLGIPSESAYCASKFALCGWTETLAMELRGTGVEVQLMLPGPIDTEIWHVPGNEAPDYAGPFIPASECAAAIVDAMEEGGFEHYVPATLPGGGSAADVLSMHNADIDGFIAMMATVGRSTDAGEEGPS